MRYFSYSALIAILTFVAISCSSQQKKTAQKTPNKITVSDAWVRPAGKGTNSAVYLTINNRTASADTLISVKTGAANMASVHKTTRKNGMTGMHHTKSIVIEAHSKLVLEPGGYHIMLMGLNQKLQKGDTLKLSLTFAKAGTKSIAVPVSSAR